MTELEVGAVVRYVDDEGDKHNGLVYLIFAATPLSNVNLLMVDATGSITYRENIPHGPLDDEEYWCTFEEEEARA